jgi:flagellar assembly factor FliW
MTLNPTPVSATPIDDRRMLETAFGQFEITPSDVVSFPSGLPGFEAARAFVVVSTPDMGVFSLLQSTDGAVSFLVIDPRRVLADFRCVLGQTDQSRLQVSPETVLLWLSIVTFEPSGHAFVNLRAPIVINPERMLGYQVMPHNSLYPLRHPLTSE